MESTVKLTGLKSKIFDAIKASHDDGISSLEIIEKLYRDRGPVKLTVIKAHVCQINRTLSQAGTGVHLWSDRRRWYLRKGKRR
jgi:hypothetical protein